MSRQPEPRVEELVLEGDRLEIVGSHDGFAHLAGAPIHRCRFLARSGRLEVTDEVKGGRGQRGAFRPDASRFTILQLPVGASSFYGW